MLAVKGPGRFKALELLKTPLKPLELQQHHRGPGSRRSRQPDRLTEPSAAAEAVNFMFQLPVQEQQQAVENAAGSSTNHPLTHTLSNISTGSGITASRTAETAAVGKSRKQPPDLYVPLELCWLLPLTGEWWRHLSLLPAFMYRINSLLKVHKMRDLLQQAAVEAISRRGSGRSNDSSGSHGSMCFEVPDPGLLLVALTGSSAAEAFDQEGLEFLGDVVLKYLATDYVIQVGAAGQGSAERGQSRSPGKPSNPASFVLLCREQPVRSRNNPAWSCGPANPQLGYQQLSLSSLLLLFRHLLNVVCSLDSSFASGR